MSESIEHVAFSGHELVAAGAPRLVAGEVKRFTDEHPTRGVLVFDATTSDPVELDLRGTVDDVVARIAEPEGAGPVPPVRRPVGRPRLGVVAREVTLLPRHWEWLAGQPGGASVTLRKLVEAARRESAGPDAVRRGRESAYRFAFAVAGDLPGFEEAIRALFAGDAGEFAAQTECWPPDVRAHARRLAAPTFEPASEQPS